MSGFSRLGLAHNPFEPAASGTPVRGELWLPEHWRTRLESFLAVTEHTSGPKAFAILGEYGSGKTYVLRWLEREALPRRRVRPFYFDNPRTQFYDLADSLLRSIGREEFAKSLWELLDPVLPSLQLPLMERTFNEWLRSVNRHRQQEVAIRAVAASARERGITEDEEISYKLGRLVVETYDRPYFEYRDFVAGRSGSLVAEGEEAPYFAALLRALRVTGNSEALAFLMDEFEEVSLQKALSRRQAHDYLATLKRLINLTQREQFWIVLAMTPQAAEITMKLEPALWDRFVGQGDHQFQIPPLSDEDARDLVERRLWDARVGGGAVQPLDPFPEGLTEFLRADVKSSPRRLVKTCSLAVARAAERSDSAGVPFSRDYLQSVQAELYPLPSPSNGEGA